MDNKKRNLSSKDDCNVEEYTRNEHCMHSKFLLFVFAIARLASSPWQNILNLSSIHSSRLRKGKKYKTLISTPWRKLSTDSLGKVVIIRPFVYLCCSKLLRKKCRDFWFTTENRFSFVFPRLQVIGMSCKTLELMHRKLEQFKLFTKAWNKPEFNWYYASVFHQLLNRCITFICRVQNDSDTITRAFHWFSFSPSKNHFLLNSAAEFKVVANESFVILLVLVVNEREHKLNS